MTVSDATISDLIRAALELCMDRGQDPDKAYKTVEKMLKEETAKIYKERLDK